MLDTKDWPLVRMTYPAEVNDADVEVLSKELDSVLQREQRFSMVIDGSRTFSLTPKQRKMVVGAVESMADRMKLYCAGQGIVVKGALPRGVITALMWLREPPVPVKIFERQADAEAWALKQL